MWRSVAVSKGTFFDADTEDGAAAAPVLDSDAVRFACSAEMTVCATNSESLRGRDVAAEEVSLGRIGV